MQQGQDQSLDNTLSPRKRLRRRMFEILEVARPGDYASRIFDVALILLILLNVTAIMLESVEELNQLYGVWFERFDFFSVMVFSVEYVLRVWVSIENPRWRRVRHNSPLRHRLRYMRTPAAIIDLLAILPFYVALLGPSGIDLRILRAFRFLRLFKLTRYSQSMAMMLAAISDHIRSFVAAITILLIVMLLAASGIYVFEHEVQPEAFGSIPASMWWAFATLTTVGYGDVTPITAWGQAFGAAITVVGVGMVALPAGILASAFSEQLRLRESMYAELVDDAYKDGMLDEDEREMLREARLSLEMNENTASRIHSVLQERAGKGPALGNTGGDHCPHCGADLRKGHTGRY